MSEPEQLLPGQGNVCRGCKHWIGELWHRGHPTCCHRMQWDGPRYISPMISRSAAGEVCDMFEAAEAVADSVAGA